MKDSSTILDRLAALIEQSQGLDFVVPQDTGWFTLEGPLLDGIRSLLADAAEVMHVIMEFYDAQILEEGGVADEENSVDSQVLLQEIGAQISAELAVREVASLAFVSRGQLLEILEALESASARKELWLVVSHADTGLRRATKALITLEAAIREFEGLPSLDRRWVDLEDSLEIRRLYGQFRRSIIRRNPDDQTSLKSSLRSVANRIAILRDLKIYPFLRIDDRLEIRRLQKRILAWLGGEGDTSNEAGERLWTDLVSFARLLTQVNNREELREHDRRAVAKLYHQLFQASPVPSRLPQHLTADLESLLGRDDELDLLIIKALECPPETLREPLQRMRKELGDPDRRNPG